MHSRQGNIDAMLLRGLFDVRLAYTPHRPIHRDVWPPGPVACYYHCPNRGTELTHDRDEI
jgi:hypothetical protein